MKQNELAVDILDSANFSYVAETGILATCASDLAGNWTFGRLYNDAADSGIAIRSAKTGKVERFVVETYQRDGEGDLEAWVLRPVNAAIGVKAVIIYND